MHGERLSSVNENRKIWFRESVHSVFGSKLLSVGEPKKCSEFFCKATRRKPAVLVARVQARSCFSSHICNVSDPDNVSSDLTIDAPSNPGVRIADPLLTV